MKILYLYQYFSTSNGSWGTRVHEFTNEWVQNPNIQVQVITSIYYKSDLKSKGFTSRQNFNGVDVRVLGIHVNNKDGFLKRIWSFIAYAFFSSIYALFGKYDVAIASSGPITAGIPGLLAKWIRRKKMVFEVRDLWPQGAIEMGVIRNRALINFSYWFEKLCYNSADLIVTLSPGMQKEVLAKAPSKIVISVTNSANIELFSTPAKVDLKSYELQAKNYAVYAGNIGAVNNVNWMLDAAKELTKIQSDFKIVLIGDGQLKEELVRRKLNEQIDCIVFIPLLPKTELVGYIQNAKFSLVPLADTPILATSSPNKLFESWAAGIPVIITTKGWMYDFVKSHNIGHYCDPNDQLALVKLLINKNQHLNETESIKALAAAYFDKTILAKYFLDAINQL